MSTSTYLGPVGRRLSQSRLDLLNLVGNLHPLHHRLDSDLEIPAGALQSAATSLPDAVSNHLQHCISVSCARPRWRLQLRLACRACERQESRVQCCRPETHRSGDHCITQPDDTFTRAHTTSILDRPSTHLACNHLSPSRISSSCTCISPSAAYPTVVLYNDYTQVTTATCTVLNGACGNALGLFPGSQDFGCADDDQDCGGLEESYYDGI